MKKYLSILFIALALFLPARATPVSTTTSSLTVSGQTITYHVAPSQTPAYYRLAYDSGTKKIAAAVFATGKTQTVYTLYCATTWAEVQAFAATNSLTGLPATAPTH